MSEPAAFRPHWPDGLEMRKFYEIPCDDDGRLLDAHLKVLVAEDGDVHVSMQQRCHEDDHTEFNCFPSVRIRTYAGGGRNRRTRQALLWLAQAIRLDNIENGKK